ncbi:biosynthetic peptidoglycan transglycosylase [Fusibacter bizertensis]
MNKRKKNLILFLILAICLTTVSMIKVAPIVSRGYDMYKSAIQEKSIQETIDGIRNNANYITLDKIPKAYQEAVIRSEDKRFYYHIGIDLLATGRAMFNNIIEGAYVQGGSTITQQLAKNMYFSFEKKYERKIAELFVALKLESMLSKEDILELYCNITYLGEGCYGINEASNYYYKVAPEDLTTTQITILVAALKNPTKLNPNAIM